MWIPSHRLAGGRSSRQSRGHAQSEQGLERSKSSNRAASKGIVDRPHRMSEMSRRQGIFGRVAAASCRRLDRRHPTRPNSEARDVRPPRFPPPIPVALKGAKSFGVPSAQRIRLRLRGSSEARSALAQAVVGRRPIKSRRRLGIRSPSCRLGRERSVGDVAPGVVPI